MKSKSPREKGKIKFSRYFQELEEGDRVSVDEELSLQPKFPKRLQGRTGTVIGKKGNAYIIRIKDQSKEKDFLILPVHLKKIKTK